MFRTFFSLALLCAAAFGADSGVWKVAPAPPASWQRDRVSDLTARRKAVLDQIGEHSILILHAAEPRNYANDIEWPFRQENNFFYLTGLAQPGATLVLAPGAGKVRELIFLPNSDPSRESWTGHMITPAEARETSGIADVHDAAQLNQFLAAVMPRTRSFLMPGGGGRGGRGAGPADGDAAGNNWRDDFAKVIDDST